MCINRDNITCVGNAIDSMTALVAILENDETKLVGVKSLMTDIKRDIRDLKRYYLALHQ